MSFLGTKWALSQRLFLLTSDCSSDLADSAKSYILLHGADL